MDRKQFIEICDTNLKLVRVEASFSQEKMAVVIGISKKTLVEIEKGRSSLGWTGSVALCSIFCNSEVILSTFDGKSIDIVHLLAFDGSDPQYKKTNGGKLWWQTIMENEKFIIQQNIVSQHYRILTSDGRRLASSINLEDLTPIYNKI